MFGSSLSRPGLPTRWRGDALTTTRSLSSAAGSALRPFPWDLRLTPEQFALVCQANSEAVLELSASGQLIAMTPTGGDTGRRNTRLEGGALCPGLVLELEESWAI